MKERLQKAGKLWVICQQYISEEEADAAYAKAARFMSTLNKYAASLMKKYEAHGATDITGFGVLGHAQNLAEAQQHGEMDFEITSLPIIKGMDLIDKKVVNYGLLEGKGVETSGGLLIALPKDKAVNFQKEFREKFKMESWIVGRVRERKGGKNMAYLAEKTEIVIV
jgi:selenide, water dikinase